MYDRYTVLEMSTSELKLANESITQFTWELV